MVTVDYHEKSAAAINELNGEKDTESNDFPDSAVHKPPPSNQRQSGKSRARGGTVLIKQ